MDGWIVDNPMRLVGLRSGIGVRDLRGYSRRWSRGIGEGRDCDRCPRLLCPMGGNVFRRRGVDSDGSLSDLLLRRILGIRCRDHSLSYWGHLRLASSVSDIGRDPLGIRRNMGSSSGSFL
jgi:hypothetical protein